MKQRDVGRIVSAAAIVADGVKLVISDAHEGLKTAVAKVMHASL